MAFNKYFTGFKCLNPRNGNFLTFIGYLQPTPNSFIYEVEIEYRSLIYPKATVKNKELDKSCPHLNGDGSLCLFHPSEFEWKTNYLLAKKFVPIVSSWLFFYEKWEKFGVWFCDEYPHEKPKEELATK